MAIRQREYSSEPLWMNRSGRQAAKTTCHPAPFGKTRRDLWAEIPWHLAEPLLDDKIASCKTRGGTRPSPFRWKRTLH